MESGVRTKEWEKQKQGWMVDVKNPKIVVDQSFFLNFGKFIF